MSGTASNFSREDLRANRLLGHLPESELILLERYATVVYLEQAQELFSGGEGGDVSYFPLTAVVSMISEMENGDESEYGCIGREGMLGLHVALGAQPLRGRALCQLQGQAVCMDGSILRRVTNSGEAPELHRLLLRYAQATITLAQSASCNALHSVYERTARWLLLSGDRAGSDSFVLTHEFLARMLGVRRASVTDAAHGFQESDIIDYHRGKVQIKNRAALEAQSCECYAIMRDEYALVFSSPV